MKWTIWAIALLPVAAGLVVATLVADAAALSNPILYLRGDLGTLAALTGFLLSAVVNNHGSFLSASSEISVIRFTLISRIQESPITVTVCALPSI